MVQVFVYGTLKPGYANYDDYCGDRIRSAQKAQVRGKLFDLPLGYPALTVGEQWIAGYLLCFADDGCLMRLDKLEDYCPDRPVAENEYQRERIDVFDLQQRSLGVAWVYRMTPAKVQQLGGKWVASGEWFGSL
ncbi:MAG: gamma-glutamylcyclotransferase [Thermosynechococcaceae cyanobacterium]